MLPMGVRLSTVPDLPRFAFLLLSAVPDLWSLCMGVWWLEVLAECPVLYSFSPLLVVGSKNSLLDCTFLMLFYLCKAKAAFFSYYTYAEW